MSLLTGLHRELEVFGPFVNLPTRALTDYYAVIKAPISLKGVQKKIKGIHGRNETTGVSDFKSWEALEADIIRIRNNAKEYNEDGSEISLLADQLMVMWCVQYWASHELT